MYKNRPKGGRNNIAGVNIERLRHGLYSEATQRGPSQREFAEMLQRAGVDLDKNAIQRIESGKRFITDIELKALAKVLHVTYDQLLKEEEDEPLYEEIERL